MNDTNDRFAELLEIRMQVGLTTTSTTLSNLRNSAATATYEIVRDRLFRPVGYIAWANINKEAFTNIIAHRAPPKYSYEWDEGRLIFITEVLVGQGSIFALRRKIFDLFRGSRIIIVFRNGALSVYSREELRFRQTYKNFQAKPLQ